ncbi:hypothetical protein TNCV_2936151 [Trichonephila clavipes]|nr:hypothetical protein TNCV_2936151 [Trichonephila clavipes]
MALYRSPLTVTLWPSSFLKKYRPMIPPAYKAHQTVSFSGCNGVLTYTCGLASLQMRQFCLLTLMKIDHYFEPEALFRRESIHDEFIAKQNSARSP